MRTLDEYRKAHPVSRRVANANLEMLAQEAVKIDALTGDPAFDHFLSYLEAALKKTERLMGDEAHKLRDPHLVKEEEIRICKANLTALEARAATLKEIILLPKYLKDQAGLAKAQIADMAAGA